MICDLWEDNWENPTLGAWGLGWEVWMDGEAPRHASRAALQCLISSQPMPTDYAIKDPSSSFQPFITHHAAGKANRGVHGTCVLH